MPPYHYGILIVLLINVVWSTIRIVKQPEAGSVIRLLMAAAFIGIALYARIFALKAQDRIIRLEERLRLGQLVPDELKPRIEELSPSQMVALRFASDEEVVDLTRRVLETNMTDPEEIKKQIKNWRPDHARL